MLMTMLGSVTGASLLYGFARWQNSRSSKRFPRAVKSVFELVGRYGAFAVLLPDPSASVSFKIFVLSSGALGLRSPFRRRDGGGSDVEILQRSVARRRYGDKPGPLHANGERIIEVLVVASAPSCSKCRGEGRIGGRLIG
jgi:hypothetical protein